MEWDEIEPGERRRAVYGALEDAGCSPLHVSDSLPDELIAAAQTEGSYFLLKIWIYADPDRENWSASEYLRFARTQAARDAMAAVRDAEILMNYAARDGRKV